MTKGIKMAVLSMVFMLLNQGGAMSMESPKGLNVQVREAQLRSTPSFLGKIIAKPVYGERVELMAEQGVWRRVALRSGLQGWMHRSALTSRNIVLQAGQSNVRTSATGGEIALAGKGFSEEIEKEYRKSHRTVDFTWVDRMETYQVAPEEMRAFLEEGNILPLEGDAR